MRDPLRLRLRVALRVLRGHTVLYRAHVVPWAGATPSAGTNPEGWVWIGCDPRGEEADIDVFCSTLVQPVVQAAGSIVAPDDALPFIWRPEDET